MPAAAGKDLGNRRVTEQEVYRFIYDKIDTVPHLEALLQLWVSRPKTWTADELAHRLFVSSDMLQTIMDDLARQQLAVIRHEKQQVWYAYQSSAPAIDELVEAVADTYRQQLVRVTRLIHGKSTSGAWGFGEAFRFKPRND